MTYEDEPIHISRGTLRLIRNMILLASATSMGAALYNVWQLIDWHQVVQLMGAR